MAFALVAVLASTGCGAADRAPAATATARAFQTALEGPDGRAACARLSRSTASKLAQDQQKPCAQAILEQSLPTGTDVARARVYVTSAAAEVPGGDWMFLDEGPHGWEISAAGCKPTQADMPLDCQVES
jgi:hypothetical protein